MSSRSARRRQDTKRASLYKGPRPGAQQDDASSALAIAARDPLAYATGVRREADAHRFSLPGKMNPPMDVIGDSGLLRFGGFITDDLYDRHWTNPNKYWTINRMLRSPIIAGMTYAIDQIIGRISWPLEAANASTSAEQAKDFMQTCMDDMEITWQEMVGQARTYQWYGFSLQEILYKRRMGPSADPTQNSRYTDGKIGLRRIAMRAQETCYRWEFDEWGNPISVFQLLPLSAEIVQIPMSKCLHLSTVNRKQSPEGVSLLQGCWQPWRRMDDLEIFEGIGAQRDLTGLPLLRLPESLMNTNDPEELKVLQEYYKVLTRIQMDEQGGLAIPSNVYENTQIPMYQFELIRSSGPRTIDTNAIVSRYSLQVMQRLLADFLLSANAGARGGSNAAHVDKTKVFTQAIAGTADQMSAEFTRQIIYPLMRMNGWSLDDAPIMRAGDVEDANLIELAQYLTMFSAIGLPVTDELKVQLYKLADFPSNTLQDQLDAEAELEAQKQAIMLEQMKNPAPALPPGNENGAPQTGAIDEQQKNDKPVGEKTASPAPKPTPESPPKEIKAA